MKNIIIGTAGHIDHGKTTLIKALTGRETDTLKEEKKRGISINLGFTYFDLPSGKRAGVVDVPGHEKFIKNMLAGVSGMDIVLLVVSAEEGVMPQTIEHLDILNFLRVKKGIIAITKSDLVDDEYLELVKDDVRERVVGTFFEKSEIICVDSVSKRGFDNLAKSIDEISEVIEDKDFSSPARLNIDRIFSVKGFGTVVTGTLIEGKINLDDILSIYPKNIQTKVRTLQVHGESVTSAYAGQRVAINLAGIKVDDIERGDVLGQCNSFYDSMMIDVKITTTKHLNKPLQYWDRIRLYHGSKEILGRIVPLERENLESGESGYCQIRLEEPIVAKKNDLFVLRCYSPMVTIAGGIILDSNPKKHKRFDLNVIQTLKLKEKGEFKDILEQTIKKHTNEYLTIKDIIKYTGQGEEILKKELIKLLDESKIIVVNNLYIHKSHFDDMCFKIIDITNKFHLKNPLKKGVLKEEVRSKIDKDIKLKDFDVILNCLVKENKIKVIENIVKLYDFEIKLSNKQLQIKNEVENILIKDGFTPRNINEIIKNAEYKDVVELLMNDSLIKVSDDIVYHKDYYNKSKDLVIEYLKENGTINLAQFRDLTNASRRYSMAILEDFDRNKITRRIEDKRVLF